MIALFNVIFILLSINSSAQKKQLITIEGVVVDTLFEAIPFANISIANASIGTISNLEGYFKLEIDTLIHNSLNVSCIGYQTKNVLITYVKNQKIKIQLNHKYFEIDEVVIGPRENPAHAIIKAVIKNKKKNNPEKKPYNYSSKAYTKIELDIKNIEAPNQSGIVHKNFGFVFENIDTLPETNIAYLPIMIAETNSTKFHFQNNSANDTEIIHANKMAGMENASLARFTGSMRLDVNIYNNQLNFDNVNIASPLTEMPLLFYNYYLSDSSRDEKGRILFELTFTPKVKKSSTFFGKMYVVDTVFAVKKIDMRLSKSANINFLNDWHIQCAFEELEPNEWLLTRYNGFLDFQVEETESWKLPGFYGLINIVYNDFNFTIDPDSSMQSIKDARYLSSTNVMKDDEYWINSRPIELTKREADIYHMVDTLSTIPLFVTNRKAVEMFINGYYDFGKVEIGPYQNIYSHNEIEGNRFGLGMRTTNVFNKKLRVGGFLAYGTKDNRLKYSGDFDYVFRTIPRFSAHLNYSHDMRVLGQTGNPVLNSTIFSTLFRRTPNNKLTMIDEYRASIQKEWVVGILNTFSFAHYRMEPTQYVPFVLENGDSLSRIKTSEFGLSTEITPGREIISGSFERESIGSHKPIINIDMNWGVKGMFQSQYDYFRMGLRYRHYVPLYSFGYLRYSIQAGKIWGTVPYPLLKMHEGNETYIFDTNSFNMMNYYEFASDMYAGIAAEHHFHGFLFNKIPLIRRLNLREVVSARALWGTISDQNLNYMQFPDGLNSLKGNPYFETGVGIENIFKILRVDALWRFNHLDNPNTQKFGIRAGMYVTF